MAEQKPLLEEVEDRTREELGIQRWDRTTIYREAAGAATDSALPYWTVLLLSGGIATLGLALNSSAVVIGAMLIAPLLAPVVGLALALAVGDGRLAVQTAAMVLASTLGVIATSALLTLGLPYQELTAEIAARTRPTTLDLVIAVFSGLAGVVVTVARGHRLSAAIPGVAISVALIPPLAVTGFGIGTGWRGDLIRGSLLLYGANLAGIVLSGMVVFILVGMHRAEVLEAARHWHEQQRKSSGPMARLDQLAWVRSLGVIRSTPARVGLVVAFVVALSIPLRRSLTEITREVRVRSAVNAAVSQIFQVPGQSSVLSQQLVPTEQETQVFLRVATTRWYGDEARERFTRQASARAGEPVRLVLEQLPTSSGDIEQLAALFPTGERAAALPTPAPPALPELLRSLRERLADAAGTLALPDGIALAGMDLSLNDGERGALRVAYLAPAPLPPEAEQMLARQLAAAVGDPAMGVEPVHVSSLPLPPDEAVEPAAAAARRYPALRVEVVAPPADSAGARAVVARLVQQGVPRERIDTRAGTAEGTAVRLRIGVPAPPEPGSATVSPGAPRPQR